MTFRARKSLSWTSLPDPQVFWGIHAGSMFSHEETPKWRSECCEFTNGIKLAGFARTSRDPDANMWNMPLVLKYIDQFPDEWHKLPRVHRLLPDWMEHSLTIPIELKAVHFQWEYVFVPWQRAILLETRDGQVVQRLEELDEAQHDLKRARSGRPYSPGFLYNELIGSAERSSGYVD